MVLRVYKKLLINVIKWSLLIGTIYIVFISLTLGSGKEKRKVLAKQASKALKPSQNNLVIEKGKESGVHEGIPQPNEALQEAEVVLKQTQEDIKIQNKRPAKEEPDIQTQEGEKEDEQEIENFDSDLEPETDEGDVKLQNNDIDDTDDDEVETKEDKNLEKVAVDIEVETKQQGKASRGDMTGDKGKSSPNEKSCPDLEFPMNFLAFSSWQAVNETNSIFVYSAYLTRDSGKIYIVGLRTNEQEKLICQLWGGKTGTMRKLLSETEATASMIDFPGYRYASTVFTCPSDTQETPSHVSLVTQHCGKAANILKIEVIGNSAAFRRRLTVCVTPVHSSVFKPEEFAKWIEINRLLGVEKFLAYNFSSSAEMSKLLRLYDRKGIIKTVQWQPPMLPINRPTPWQDVHRYGQTAALNDCLFRCKQFSEFMSNLAYKEYMVPRGMTKMNIMDSVKTLDTKVPVYYLRKFLGKPGASGKGNTTKDKEKTINFPPSEMAKRTLLIRTHEVNFTLPRIVPNVASYIIPHDKVLIHLHTELQYNQLLGKAIEDVLPAEMRLKAEANIKAVLDELNALQ